MPKILWKSYIASTSTLRWRRALYERLIALCVHVKVWISYELFDAEAIPLLSAERDEGDEDEAKKVPGEPVLAQQVFERGYKDLKGKNLKSEVCSDT